MVGAAAEALIDRECQLGVDNFLLGLHRLGLLAGFVATLPAAELWLARAGMTDLVFLWHKISIP